MVTGCFLNIISYRKIGEFIEYCKDIVIIDH